MTAGSPRRRGRPPAGGREAILIATAALLRERGIAHLSTREIAARANVSEASIFYHYTDRTGLLWAVLESALVPLQEIGAHVSARPAQRTAVMTELGTAIETFLDAALPVLAAAQADPELRALLAAEMRARDLGLHRGVRALGGYLAREQAAGRVRSDVDPTAIAFALVSTCHARASMRHMALHEAQLPPLADVVAALDTSLDAPGAGSG
ncbi:MAG: TetR/AcrR family transcriptional regulator [Actinomycetota bacterium]|nr:TetR/AcrR family transcriptional regulator [Actinomycetota bacterium]